jgi:hypothetical protein
VSLRGERRTIFFGGTSIEIIVDDRNLVPELRDFLLRAACRAERCSTRSIIASVPTATDSDEERRRLALIVAGWHALHPTVQVSFSSGRNRRGAGAAARLARQRPPSRARSVR